MVETPNQMFGRVTLWTDNPAGTGAPGAGNDVTQGYCPGSRWYDTVGAALYVCTDNTAAAAVWSQQLLGGLPGTGTVAGGSTTISGGNTATGTPGGLILSGGSASSGSVAGGNVTIEGGLHSGNAADGYVVIPRGRLPTANPSVAGALYGPANATTAGAVSISGG